MDAGTANTCTGTNEQDSSQHTFLESVMPIVETYVEVDVDLTDFDTDDLLDELESRGALPVEGDDDAKEIVEQMYQLHRLGRPYEHLMSKLFYGVLGKIV